MLEDKLKNLIIEKYGSVRQFSIKIDIPYTTVDSILKRGLDNSNVGNVIKMCKALDISIDNLLDNKEIISNLELDNADLIENKYKDNFDEFEILFDKHKDILTEDDKEYIKFIIEKRKKEIDKELGEE